MSEDQEEGLTRRSALAAGLAAATLAALPGGGCTPAPPKSDPGSDEERASPGAGRVRGRSSGGGRMPVAFLPHGGGPWPFVELGLDEADKDDLAGYLRSLRTLPKVAPRALLVISAHWEEPVPTVMTAERPPILYDYYGFPPESYAITWPAPGNPELAARVQELLGAAGLATASDAKRGFDHGTFIPLKLTYPDADVPTVQLSLKRGLDPEEHLVIGRALAPLRDEGVFILGSGMSYHDMRGFGDPRARAVSEAFDAWLRETAALDPRERDRRLAEWSRAPAARGAHPREEHLLPLMVVAGAAGADRGMTAYSGSMWGVRLSAYHFGSVA